MASALPRTSTSGAFAAANAGGNIRPIAVSSTASIPPALHLLRHRAKRSAGGLRKRRHGVRKDEAVEPRAVADRELRRDERAEAVAENGSVGSQLEGLHDEGDVIRMVRDRLERDRARAAKAGKIDPRYAAHRGERRQHAIEDAQIGEQGMQEQQSGPAAGMVVLDLQVGERDVRHGHGYSCSRLGAGHPPPSAFPGDQHRGSARVCCTAWMANTAAAIAGKVSIAPLPRW